MCSWTPHTHFDKGKAAGYNQVYLDSLAAAAEPLRANGLPVIFTLKHLAIQCGVQWGLLENAVARRIIPYRFFYIHKRNGTPRPIAIPHPQLLITQRFLHSELLSRLSAHCASMAYAKSCSPKRNAGNHAGAKWLVKMDISDFFSSITERDVYKVYRAAGYRPLLAFQMSRISTIVPRPDRDDEDEHKNPDYSIYGYDQVGYLPQGAPTSPLLANLASRWLDDELSCIARQFGCVYTRYADDLTISFSQTTREKCQQLVQQVGKVLGKRGFAANERKTRIVTPGARKVVTGLIVNTDKPTVPRATKDRVRMHLYYCQKVGVSHHCERRGFKSIAGFRAHLQGLISYIESVQPELGNSFRSQMQTIEWPDLAGELYGTF